LSAAVARQISNPNARLWMTIETGIDEAGVVGTSDAYLRLAAAALKLAGAADRHDIPRQTGAGYGLPASNHFKGGLGPVEPRITGGWLAPSDVEVTAVRRFFGDFYESTDSAEPDAAADKARKSGLG